MPVQTQEKWTPSLLPKWQQGILRWRSRGKTRGRRGLEGLVKHVFWNKSLLTPQPGDMSSFYGRRTSRFWEIRTLVCRHTTGFHFGPCLSQSPNFDVFSFYPGCVYECPQQFLKFCFLGLQESTLRDSWAICLTAHWSTCFCTGLGAQKITLGPRHLLKWSKTLKALPSLTF